MRGCGLAWLHVQFCHPSDHRTMGYMVSIVRCTMGWIPSLPTCGGSPPLPPPPHLVSPQPSPYPLPLCCYFYLPPPPPPPTPNPPRPSRATPAPHPTHILALVDRLLRVPPCVCTALPVAP